MKLRVFIMSIISILTILIASNVFAATGTVELKSSTKEVKKGDSFTVTLQASSEDGINGIDTKYTYETEELELISESIVDSKNWSNLGVSPDITVISNSTENIKKADIYTITFKVKDNVSVGNKIVISTTEILLDTNAQSNSEITIDPQKIELTVVKDAEETNTNQNTNTDGQTNNSQNTNNNNETNNSVASNTTVNNNTNNTNNSVDSNTTVNNNSNTTAENNSNTVVVNNSNTAVVNTKDEDSNNQTQSSYNEVEDNVQVNTNKKSTEELAKTAETTKLPKTGINYLSIVIITTVIAIIAIASYMKYAYFKDIK